MEESSISIESTSYAILTSLAMNDLNSARPFVNFLLRAMKPGGVFVSSQVTCCKEFMLVISNIYLNIIILTQALVNFRTPMSH